MLTNPVQGRDLVSKAVVAWQVVWNGKKPISAESVIDSNCDDILTSGELPAIASALPTCRIISIAVGAANGVDRILTSEASAMDPEDDRSEVLCRPCPGDVWGLDVEKEAVLATAAVLQALWASQLSRDDRAIAGVDLGISEAAGELSIADTGEPERLLVPKPLVSVA